MIKINHFLTIFHSRGKTFCIGRGQAEVEEERWDLPVNGQGEQKQRILVDFPGEKDEGTPMIMKENDHSTVVGMFLKTFAGASLVAQVTPNTVNWIRQNADWTQESTCNDRNWKKENIFTSCSCGMSNGDDVQRHKRSIDNEMTNETSFNHNWFGKYVNNSSFQYSNRIRNGDNVENHKYPWQVLVINKLVDSSGMFHEDPDGSNFDICSGSIISNKHILTSAECLLKNKNNNLIEYSDKEMIFVKLGDHERRAGEYVSIKHIVPHEKAFTEGYNYNIGNLF